MSEVISFVVPAGLKPGACAAAENQRFAAMDSALLQSGSDGKANLIATDGFTISVLPLTEQGPAHPILLPADAVNANGKCRSVECNGEVRSTSGKITKVFPLPQTHSDDGIMRRFPNLVQVMNVNLAGYRAITLDSKLLSQLASAISSSGVVTLFLPDDNPGQERPIAAVGIDQNSALEGVGLLMPLLSEKQTIDQRREHYRSVVANLPGEIKFVK